MSLSVLRLNIITAAALLPAYLRVGAFVPPVISTRCASKESVGSSSRWSAPARSTAAAASVEEAKNNLKRALVDSKGSTLAPDVVAAVEVGVYALSARNMSTATVLLFIQQLLCLDFGACFELIILLSIPVQQQYFSPAELLATSRYIGSRSALISRWCMFRADHTSSIPVQQQYFSPSFITRYHKDESVGQPPN